MKKHINGIYIVSCHQGGNGIGFLLSNGKFITTSKNRVDIYKIQVRKKEPIIIRDETIDKYINIIKSRMNKDSFNHHFPIKIKLLELFAGSRSIGKEGDKLGMEVYSVDYTAYDDIDLVTDIYNLKKEDIPFIPDVIWASPDCTTYSIAACSTHRNPDKTAKSDYAKICDIGNQHWLNLMKEWLVINPKMIYFIENPRGNFRHMTFMKEFTRHTVWYCQYGDERAKPTDIWTNSKTWKPRPMCRNYKYDKEGNIIDKHCNHESARRGARTGTQGRKNAHERSKIPKELCLEILQSI